MASRLEPTGNRDECHVWRDSGGARGGCHGRSPRSSQRGGEVVPLFGSASRRL
jgi:hypothetical protein